MVNEHGMKERSGTYPSLKAAGISEDRIVQTKDGETTGFTHPNSRLSWLGRIHHSALMQPLLSSRHF